MNSRLAGAFLLGVVFGCTPPEAPRYAVAVRVESDPGQPVDGANVSSAGKALGKTDARGLAVLALTGELGAQVALNVRCPEGFRQPSEGVSVILRPAEPNTPAPEYRVMCPPSLRSLVVSVRAPNAVNVPLRHLGKELARTDAQGAAHALLKLPPGQDLNLVLDTSAPEHHALRPRSPSFKLTVPDRDDVVLFDQAFLVDAPPAAKPKVVRPDLPERF
jgi:hypothetical protein